MGVFVVGMHRSGTSAAAAVLSSLGLDAGAAAGQMRADPANPDGYLELREIAELDDALLAHLGGRWDCPPVLSDGWENDPALTPFVRRAMTTKAAVLPREGWLLKDPRVTLLLPLWRRAVLDRCAAVLVVRNPMEVAWSVTLRNGIPTMTALALWSAYNRAALHGLGGLPVYVLDYARLVGEPRAAVAGLAAALTSWGELRGEPDLDAAAACVRPELRRNTWRRDAPDALDRPGEIDRLEKLLVELAGAHGAFEPPRPPPAPWEEALLSERRRAFAQLREATAERDGLAEQLAAAEEALARLDAELSAARAAAAEASAREREHRARAAAAGAALTRANARWDRLERRLPVRAFRALQRFVRSLRPVGNISPLARTRSLDPGDMPDSLPPRPTFVIIGAQKSATRWLRTNLGEHPDIFTAPAEPHFWDVQHRVRSPRAWDWYRAKFAGGRASPSWGRRPPDT